jgi:hypothetical protein
LRLTKYRFEYDSVYYLSLFLKYVLCIDQSLILAWPMPIDKRKEFICSIK